MRLRKGPTYLGTAGSLYTQHLGAVKTSLTPDLSSQLPPSAAGAGVPQTGAAGLDAAQLLQSLIPCHCSQDASSKVSVLAGPNTGATKVQAMCVTLDATCLSPYEWKISLPDSCT